MSTFKHHILDIANTLFITMSVLACTGTDDPACPPANPCPDPKIQMAGIRVAGDAARVADMADDKSCLIVHPVFSSSVVVVNANTNEKVYTLDVSKLLQSGESLLGVFGLGFLGHSSDSILVSTWISQSNRDTASRVFVVNIRTGSLSTILPSRCLENGWDPVLRSWFIVHGIERLTDRTLLVRGTSLRYDFAADQFLDVEMTDPQGAPYINYVRTWQSGLLLGFSISSRGPEQTSIMLVVDGTTVDISALVDDVIVIWTC